MIKKRKIAGFTLIEMMLVLVLIAIILYASIGYMQQRTLAMRVDKTATTMQQILNAAMAYYVVNGYWPTDVNTLQINNGYLPSTGTLYNPWGNRYFGGPGGPAYVPNANPATPPKIFYVWSTIPAGTGSEASAVAAQIAGALPLGYVTSDPSNPPTTVTACASGASCNAVATVNIPGQNLNNANAVTFAGIYRQGGCVPVPSCPIDSSTNPPTAMTPQIMVVPVSVSGNNTSNTTSFPITSFTAYALPASGTPLTTNPPSCTGSQSPSPSCLSNINGAAATAYWRACLKVMTQYGDVQSGGNPAWGGNVALMAITRCAVNNEPAGTVFTVFGN